MTYLRLLARLWLGGTFLVLSVAKIRFPMVFASAIQAYDLLPPVVVAPAAVVVPWIEFIGGLCLVLGLANRAACLLLGGLSGVFTVMVGVTLTRGLDISCGCFLNESMARIGLHHMLFDLALVTAANVIYLWGPGPLCLDRLLLGGRDRATSV